MSFSFHSNQIAAEAIPIASTRKRKDMGDDDDAYMPTVRRDSSSSMNTKGFRRLTQLPHGSEEALFHPLPPALNLQILANMGYNVTDQYSPFPAHMKSGNGQVRSNHSPSSSASSLCPSTPNDVVAGSVESYFSKGIQSEAATTPSYPNFNIYPEQAYCRPVGLLGVHMQRSQSEQSACSIADDGMDVDGAQRESEAGPSHGEHCKSIPQLHCKGAGPTKELWAHCPDCGLMSPVDCAPIPPALAYSP